MIIDIITLFPNMFSGPFEESIISRAKNKGLVEINIHYLRNWTTDKHHTVDDKPFGGGAGMVLMVEPIYKAIKELKKKNTKVYLVCPQGSTFNQQIAQHMSQEKHIILISGHYEGFDERIREHLVDDEISIGDYVLTGGELPSMVIVDTIVRLIPGVLGDNESLSGETHSRKGLVKHPVYTRPENFKGWKVPNILLSGDHAKISEWKKENNRPR
ncbi:tRNA (guanosine(37)-N1)-methyltransferase TrmD [Candidatus Woesebacteria bacterium]|nr:MAG: tRNA (guanosine(37)-N1)-methyltransferase TrmD [Candidatus Woesebacteria bacterium]